MSVVEEDSEAEEQVAQLRRADTDAPEAAPSTCGSIDQQDQSDQLTYRFEGKRGWRKRVCRLKPSDRAQFKPYIHNCYYQLTLKFSTTQQAKPARDRIFRRTA